MSEGISLIRIALTLILVALTHLPLSATADLIVTDASGASKVYSFRELDRLVGEIEREIPDDYLFNRSKRYRGYDLSQLFTALGLSKDEQYLLVCTDGYEIEFDARKLYDKRFKGLLARADIEAGDNVWLPYKVGAKPASLSPFYLAWSADTEDARNIARETFPWPYALSEIRLHDPDHLHAAAMPASGAPDGVMRGFKFFTSNCMKCHKINAAGGSLGPELTTSPVVTFATDEELIDVIVNIEHYYPSSKMPSYHDVLTPDETDSIVRYLRYINESASRR